jgi:two-component system, NtrC family, sensor histidine kinase GlrK
MQFARPRSLSALLLVGLGIIALPLIGALLTAAVQMRRLAENSERLVVEGVQATRLTQELFAQIVSLERNVRLYQVLADEKLVQTYRQRDLRLTEVVGQLGQQLRAEEARQALQDLAKLQGDIADEMLNPDYASRDVKHILASFESMDTLAARVAERGNVQIDADLASLRVATARAQKQLFWESALLVPLAIAAILVFTLGIGRPLRQIDRAIDELGRGAFFRPIRVSGPIDLERLGRQLEWLRQRLLDFAQERNRFLRHMSHELKTPLANIREGTELLMDGAVGPLENSQREVAGILRENGIRLQRMIENLLSFSAWQTNSVGLELSEFRIRPVIKQVIENQQLALLAQRVRLDVRVEDLTLFADRGKLRLILENLLSNAVKYSPRSGTIFVKASAEIDQFVLEVADSGPGIPPEERGHVFEAFYTGRAPGGNVKGTGIGLSVVLEFVTVHRGNIEIIEGQWPGAHFRIRMPLRATPTASEQLHALGDPRKGDRAHAA